MALEKVNPGAIAVAHRVDVTELAGKNDFADSTPSALDLQVRRILRCYAVSESLAVVVAENAFLSGRGL